MRAKRKRNRILNETGQALNKAGDNGFNDSFVTYQRTEVPGTDTSTTGQQQDAFIKARMVARTNYWLKSFLKEKTLVCNFGLDFTDGTPLQSGKPKKKKSKGSDPLTEWLDKPIQTLVGLPPDPINNPSALPDHSAPGAPTSNRELITALIEQVWREFVLMDNCIVAWIGDTPPAILPLEKCRFIDKLGIFTLYYRHGLSKTDVLVLAPDERSRYEKAEIVFNPSEAEFFRVLTSDAIGSGLSWPSIQSVFRTIATMESMEMAEAYYAFGARSKFWHWKKGHEITTGPMAGKPTHFWKTENSKLIQKVFENKSGWLGPFCTNFDFTQEQPHEATDYYKKEKWESPEHRLMRWGGPLAQIMADKGRAADLLPLLRAEVLDLRRKVGIFLEPIINQGFKPPVPIKLIWSNTIFSDPRVIAEDRKFGVTAGALSHQTWREEAGFNDAREQTRKEQEAAEVESNPKKFQPPFDPAHGVQRELTPGGSPPGKSHTDNKNQG